MTRVLRLVGVLAIPTAGTLAAFVLAIPLAQPINAPPFLTSALTSLGFALPVMAVAVLTAAIAWRWRGSQPTWTIPLLLSAGLSIATASAALVDVEGFAHLAGDLVGVAVWGAGVGAGVAVARVLGRRSRGQEALVAGVAAVLASDLAVIVAGVLRVSADEAPRLFAPLWYPSLTFNVQSVFGGDAGVWIVADQLAVLPVLLTVASAFVIGHVAAAGRIARHDIGASGSPA